MWGNIPVYNDFDWISRIKQRLLRTSIESGKYDDKDDFAAVYQPFLEDSEIPRLPVCCPLASYFCNIFITVNLITRMKKRREERGEVGKEEEEVETGWGEGGGEEWE